MSSQVIFAGIAIILFIAFIVLFVNGITKMHEEHPDYKGNDLFNEDE